MASVVCTICRDTDNNSQYEWRALPCGHVMHEACLTTWFQHNPVCPNCNRRPRSSAIRIYFATEESRGQRETAAAAASGPPADPHELEQLQQMLFMEAQERDLAWRLAEDSEKRIIQLVADERRSRLEADRLAKELESCQVALMQRHSEAEQVIHAISQSQQDIQTALLRAQEDKAMLSQQLRQEQQQREELTRMLGACQEAGAVASSGLEWQMAQLRGENQRLGAALSDSSSRLQLEQDGRQLDSVRLQSLQEQNSDLMEQIRGLQFMLTALKTGANEKVNEEKALHSVTQSRLQDAEKKSRDALESLRKAELEKQDLTRRLTADSVKLKSLQDQNSDLMQQIRTLQSMLTALKSKANEKVNEEKALHSVTQSRLQDAEKKSSDALESLELEKQELTRRLMKSEQEVLALESRLMQLPEGPSVDKPGGTPTQQPGAKTIDQDLQDPDNFSDFPLFDMPTASRDITHQPRALSVPQLFRPEPQLLMGSEYLVCDNNSTSSYDSLGQQRSTSMVIPITGETPVGKQAGKKRGKKSCRQM